MTAATAFGIATPAFVAAIVLITVFAVNLGWFPVFGSGEGFWDRLWHLTLPAVALAFTWCAYVTQITKASVREELGREHVETARSRGIPWPLIVRRHVFRNALIPITTVAGLTVAGLIAGAVVVEQAFGLNGMGSFLVQSASQKDFAVVQAISLLLVTAFVVGERCGRPDERPARPAAATEQVGVRWRPNVDIAVPAVKTAARGALGQSRLDRGRLRGRHPDHRVGGALRAVAGSPRPQPGRHPGTLTKGRRALTCWAPTRSGATCCRGSSTERVSASSGPR